MVYFDFALAMTNVYMALMLNLPFAHTIQIPQMFESAQSPRKPFMYSTNRLLIFSTLIHSGLAFANNDFNTIQPSQNNLPYAETQASPALDSPSSGLKSPHLRVTFYGLAAGIDGNIQLGQHQVSPRITFSEVWDDADNAILAHIDYKYKKFGMYYDVQSVKTSSVIHAQLPITPAVSIPVQADVRTKLRRSTLSTYYTAYEGIGWSRHHGIKIEPTLGLRHTKVQASADVHSDALPFTANMQASTSWYEPYLGSRVTYAFNPKLSVFSQIDVGAQKSKDLQAYASYRTSIKKRPTYVIAGYRYIDQKHQQSDFTWHIKEHGPVLGLSVQLF